MRERGGGEERNDGKYVGEDEWANTTIYRRRWGEREKERERERRDETKERRRATGGVQRRVAGRRKVQERRGGEKKRKKEGERGRDNGDIGRRRAARVERTWSGRGGRATAEEKDAWSRGG